MRPNVTFLTKELIEQIISEGRDLLCHLGVEIHNDQVISLLADHGAKIDKDKRRVFYTQDMIDGALKTAPSAVTLYDSAGEPAVDLSGYEVSFTPGSSSIYILDSNTDAIRKPSSTDYVNYVKLVDGLEHIASQSTAMIPDDVPEQVSDTYRLYLSLMFSRKPVVTGTFTAESFEVMKDLQLAVRGSAEALAAKPLTLFSCCPTSPLKWSDITSQNVVDCAKYGIPVEFVAMPLSGFMAPVTLVGSLVQHTAETLSGVVISQLTKPGAPMVYGGSPAIFDLRYETTPMGAIGTMMIDCAYNEIGKYFGIPTQAYIGLSDAKLLDAQAGMETSMGATLAALAGVNNISGPGMIDFENCFSLEKLVLDNEICGMMHRMLKGIVPKEDFPARPHIEELIAEGHLLISDHTRKHVKEEIYFPGPVIDRANRSRWQEEGSRTLKDRARSEVDRIIGEHQPVALSSETKTELTRLMTAASARHGKSDLPQIN